MIVSLCHPISRSAAYSLVGISESQSNTANTLTRQLYKHPVLPLGYLLKQEVPSGNPCVDRRFEKLGYLGRSCRDFMHHDN